VSSRASTTAERNRCIEEAARRMSQVMNRIEEELERAEREGRLQTLLDIKIRYNKENAKKGFLGKLRKLLER